MIVKLQVISSPHIASGQMAEDFEKVGKLIHIGKVGSRSMGIVMENFSTTPIVKREGNVFTTGTGSVYRLTKIEE